MTQAQATAVKAKFICHRVDEQGTTTEKWGERVALGPVYSTDPNSPNADWAKATPSGMLEMYITNPAAWGAFIPGQEYFLEITPV